MPRLSVVSGISGNAFRAFGVFIIPSHGNDVAAAARQTENSARSIAASHGSFSRRPRSSVIVRAKDASCRAARAKINVVIAPRDRSPTRGKCTFRRKRRRHFVARQFLPMPAVACAQHQKPAIDRIAQRETMRSGFTRERIKKKSGALIGVLQLPRFSPIGSFVDA